MKSTNYRLSDILEDDDKLLFCLDTLGNLQKNEKLTEHNGLLSVDNRYYFQSIRRWWSNDDRQKSARKTLLIITSVSKRINDLTIDNNNMDHNKIRLINKYYLAMIKAKIGINNIRLTYTDQFTKNIFDVSVGKIDDMLSVIEKYKNIK